MEWEKIFRAMSFSAGDKSGSQTMGQGLCHQGSPAATNALVVTGRVQGEEQEILKMQKATKQTKPQRRIWNVKMVTLLCCPVENKREQE